MKTSPKILIPAVLTLIVCLALAIGWQLRKRQSIAESVARDALRDLGVFVVLDADRVHVASVDLRLPDAKPNVGVAMELVPDLPYVEVLQLGGTDVTDQQLKWIAANTSLVAVGLNHTAIGDAGLESLAELDNLKALYLAETNITPIGLKQLRQMSQLEILDLSETGVATDDLASLPILKNLKHLLLRNVDLSDEAMVAVANQPSLSRLTIAGGNVSEQAIGQLTKAKPGLQIDH